MYRCHMEFYLVNCPPDVLETVQQLPPLDGFNHSFLDSNEPREALLSRADVVLAVPVAGADSVRALAEGMKEDAWLILLADREQAAELGESLSLADELWILPMAGAELKFRFARWQEKQKLRLDLWQTSQYLEATINSTPSLVWYKDKDGIHEKVNDAFCATVNKTKEQVQGRGHAYIWDVEEDDPACIESERIVMEMRETRMSEEAVQTGEGKRLLTTYKSPLYDYDGSVMGTVGVAIDVTQERAYEQEIVNKNRELENLFTTMDCGVMCHSLDGSRMISVNRAALQILGYESQEALLADGFDMVASSVLPEDRARLEECIKTLSRVGDNVNIEYRVRHTNGDILHVMGNIKLIEEDGELFYQRFLLDYTTQKLREEERRLAEERRQAGLVQALTIDYNLVCVFDLDSGIGRSLRIYECKLGVLEELFSGELTLETCMGDYINRCVYAEDRELMRQICTRDRLRIELGANSQFYNNYRTQCGDELRYFQMKAVRTGDWSTTRAVVLGFRSVDEETRKELEQMNLLRDALDQANRASKAKSVFLSNMSHDIRTPMNAIIGFTALATTHIDQRDQVEGYLKKIMTSGNHLLSLINDVLDMSRIESGKMSLEEKPCSMPDILHGLRSIVQADVHAKQLELYMDAVDVMNEEIYCDRLRLNQILLNLLSNSVKYTPAGGVVSVKVTEKPGAPAGHATYEFCIKDTGIGMSEEFVSRIFEPFERERNSTTSGIQGTGLGMAITKNIVDMMNGTISVRSKQGVGTEFIVVVTFRLCTEEREPQTIPELKNCRALVVDDDFNTCDSVSCMLQQIGMRAEWTLSGKEAVLRTRQAVMRNDVYSVYIIDWLLPDMNGVEVARRVRKEIGEQVPIIVLTAYDWSEIEDEAREAGISAFCSKPLFLSELRSCLMSVVGTEEKKEEDSARKGRTNTGRILLVEDNELNQEIATAILSEAGFQVETAEDGRQAVELVSQSQPGWYQLVLMDVQMPVMNGYEATRCIRQLENRQLADIPILAMTANAFEEDKQEALRSGMNGHISKPINIEKLLETLNEMLS
ncbi:MAG: response regulator [Lawsonibacter sp.]|nr:response regulator [Lawsonibacter sp.]